MSTRWDVWCIDCSDFAGIEDCYSEHRMWALVHHADAIAAFSAARETIKPLHQEDWEFEAELTMDNQNVDTAWFVQHRGHQLVPKNEYGQLATQCHRQAKCPHCGQSQNCKRPLNHEGEHSATAETR